MLFRLRYDVLGGHVHCRLFQAADRSQTWALTGDLTFDEAGWAAFATVLSDRIEMVTPSMATHADHARMNPHLFVSQQLNDAHNADEWTDRCIVCGLPSHTDIDLRGQPGIA